MLPGPFPGDRPCSPHRDEAMSVQLADLIAIQSQGARTGIRDGVRRGGAGPADAGAFVIDDHPVMIPILSASAQDSEYALIPEDNAWRLEKNGHLLCRARPVPQPAFYAGRTADGIPYAKIARLHGRDCLASTVIQECVRYNSLKTRCRFCAIGASLEHSATIHTKTPQQLAEVALAAKNLDHVRHVTLTSGTTANPDIGAAYLGECARAVKTATGLPVAVQFEPLRDKGLYARLRAMGVDDVGLHIESFDPAVRKRMTPGKAVVDIETYFDAFAAAVAVFGRNKVSTYVILGLGEDEELTLEGCRRATALGVYPVIVPLRPLLDSCLSDAPPVDPAYLDRMYRAVGKMLEANGLSHEASTAGCVKCRACSLLQFVSEEGTPVATRKEEKRAGGRSPRGCATEVEVAVASTPEEIAEYHRIRHEVFVREQGVFTGSDVDAHDRNAVVIVARAGNRVAGGVRCYHHRGGVWFGGRLAVSAEFRSNLNIGAMLVRKAVATMEVRGGVRRFLAMIQQKNVRYFQRLGWLRLGRPFDLHGHKHQIMEKKLDIMERRPGTGRQ